MTTESITRIMIVVIIGMAVMLGAAYITEVF
jgi:hypothetical protein